MHRKVREDVVIDEVSIAACKHCQSSHIVKIGIRHNASGDVQVFKCKECRHKLSFNLGFEKMRATPDQITAAMNLYFNGESSRKTAQSLTLLGVKTTHTTIQNWIKKYVGIMDKYLDRITPQVGENRRTDELYLRIMQHQATRIARRYVGQILIVLKARAMMKHTLNWRVAFFRSRLLS